MKLITVCKYQNQDLQINVNNNTATEYCKKIVLPTADELKKHKEYLKSDLKKNFFN